MNIINNPESFFVTFSTNQDKSYQIELQPTDISEEKAITVGNVGYKILGPPSDVSWIKSSIKSETNNFENIDSFKNVLNQCTNPISNEKIQNIVFKVLPDIQTHETPLQLNKQKIWDLKVKEVDLIVDALGLPIDPKIKDTVVALNVLGIPTSGSCEGHLNWGESIPYIDIELASPELNELQEKRYSIAEKAEKEIIKLRTSHPDTHDSILLELPEAQAYKDCISSLHDLDAIIAKEEQFKLKPLYDYLNKFYADYRPMYDRMLAYTPPGRIKNLGAEQQAMRSAEEKKIKLEEYQAEMKKFGEFLKKEFFSSSDK